MKKEKLIEAAKNFGSPLYVYDASKIKAWESGKTGFPYIDAMMRQLESTGWMHHLGRHAVSCFLTRGQLWQNWKVGRDIFDRKLVDSDWALNNGNWLCKKDIWNTSLIN